MASYYVYGRNAVREALRAGDVNALYIRERQEKDEVVSLAHQKSVSVRFVSDKELDRLAGSPRHQGFVAEAKAPEFVSLKEIIAKGKSEENPLVLLLDGIEDPVNLGAILRSCDAFGVTGVVLKNNGGVTLNATVAKVSTGAVHYVPVCSMANLSQAVSELKDAGYWIVSSDGEAKQTYDEVDYKGPIGLIVGSEGFGISRLLLNRSDFIVKIPMVGHVNSLNASVATGIFLSFIHFSRKNPR